ncbi:MAG: hypothetical protein LUC93_02435 [Planctomycetaceae bacterium]|nr:hypothetical protein [Planctomycetaceae bacterium]
MDQFALHLPRIAFGIVCLVVVYVLFRYKKKNDFNLWMREQHRDITRAASDAAYCQETLAETKAALAAFGQETVASPLTKRQEVVLRAYPRLMFLLGGMGVAMIFVAVVSPTETDGVDWPLYAGPIVLVAAAVMYYFHRRERRAFTRVQLLNRKYLLEKTLNHGEMFETMRELLKYYPNLVPLWVEMATQHAEKGDMAAAIAVIRDAEAEVGDNLDLALTEISFRLRQKDVKAAEKRLKRAESYPRQASDPRIALYFGAIALEKGDQEEAKRRFDEAMGLDSRCVGQFITQDQVFLSLKTLVEEENEAKSGS